MSNLTQTLNALSAEELDELYFAVNDKCIALANTELEDTMSFDNKQDEVLHKVLIALKSDLL